MATENGNFITFCLVFPPKMNSHGIWGHLIGVSDAERPSPLPLLEFQMLMVFCVTMLLHFVLQLFGLPIFVSQMIAGLVLGSSWRGHSKSFDDFKDLLFFIGSQEILGMVTGFGYTLFVFLIGVRMDLGVVKRSGRQTLITGVLSIIVPALLGLMAAVGLSRSGEKGEAANLEFIAANQSYTSFAVVVCLFEHLKIMSSKVGRLVLSCTIIADMVGLSFSFIVSVVSSSNSIAASIKSL